MTTLHNWHRVKSAIVIPIGLIIPFNGDYDGLPSGWSQYDGGDKAVLGVTDTAGVEAGVTYDARSTSSNGSHTGNRDFAALGSYTGTGPYKYYNSSGKGSHSHSMRIYYTPQRAYLTLMKATAEHKKWPINTGILATAAQAGASDITPTGDTLYGVGTGSPASQAVEAITSGSWSSAGQHHHLSTSTGSAHDGGTKKQYLETGNHSTHGFTGTATDAMYRFYMGVWSSAAAELKASSGNFAMWESSTPPDGWAICDGTLGTPDLSRRFIGFDSGAAMGTSDGDGTVTLGGSAASGGSHGHRGNNLSVASAVVHYHSNTISHTHTVSALQTAWEQEHKTLIFIMAL